VLVALSASARAQGPLFEDRAAQTGLDFQHFIGATGSFFTPEILGSGVALLDYDNDGDLDVYFVQGVRLGAAQPAKVLLFEPPKEHWPGNRLFRNDLVPTGELRFVDVTEQARVQGTGAYGMGVAVGDYDNDGDTDIFVSNFGPDLLLRNNGDGTFTDISAKAGIGDDAFGASAAFLDYDRDGDLDLFVTRYYGFTTQANRECLNSSGGRDYCGPGEYPPLPDRLYRNEGNGRFINVTGSAGIGAAFGNGLGVVATDFNRDGWLDIYVANDKTANQLWINQRDGTFDDQALLAGCAYSGDGKAEAGMGVTVADYDADGDEDIFVTHLRGEKNTLYRNDGSGLFDDVTVLSGLAHTSIPFTAFGTLWFDYDNDGLLDLFVANGEVRILEELRGQPFPYGQRNQLFHNVNSKFQEVTDAAGPSFKLSEVSRGAAFGDVDNDGDIDIVVSNANGPARLLLNQVGTNNHWLKVRLEGVKTNRDGYGAIVFLIREEQSPIIRHAATDGSYLSANSGWLHFGLGNDSSLASHPLLRIVVEWPAGSSETWKVTEPDSLLTLHEGEGKPARLAPGAGQLRDAPGSGFFRGEKGVRDISVEDQAARARLSQ
jgi:hypothetical protein